MPRGQFISLFAISRGAQYAFVTALAVVASVMIGYSFHTGGRDAHVQGGRSFIGSPRTDKPPTVLVIGDSYAAGTGASAPSAGWVWLLADEAGWLLANHARGGTGYVAEPKGATAQTACGSQRCPNFVHMAQAADREITPDVVLVSGGRNDVTSPAPTAAAAVREFFQELRGLFPRARIIAVSPLWDDDPPPAALQTIRSEVAASVNRVHGTLIDVKQPLRGHPEKMSQDGVHPNNAGHAAIEQAVLHELMAQNIVSTS